MSLPMVEYFVNKEKNRAKNKETHKISEEKSEVLLNIFFLP